MRLLTKIKLLSPLHPIHHHLWFEIPQSNFIMTQIHLIPNLMKFFKSGKLLSISKCYCYSQSKPKQKPNLYFHLQKPYKFTNDEKEIKLTFSILLHLYIMLISREKIEVFTIMDGMAKSFL